MEIEAKGGGVGGMTGADVNVDVDVDGRVSV
jgi:hypothetical protein